MEMGFPYYLISILGLSKIFCPTFIFPQGPASKRHITALLSYLNMRHCYAYTQDLFVNN